LPRNSPEGKRGRPVSEDEENRKGPGSIAVRPVAFGIVVSQAGVHCLRRWKIKLETGLNGHAANQLPEFAFDARASGFPAPRLPSPVQLESHAAPLDARFRVRQWLTRIASEPRAGRARPRDPVAGPQLRAFDGVLVDGNLLYRRARFSAARLSRGTRNARSEDKLPLMMPTRRSPRVAGTRRF